MLLEVKVIPKAGRNLVKEEGGRLKVYLTAAAEKGKANKALVDELAVHFRVGKNRIRIVRGAHSPVKLIDVNL